MVYVSRGGFNPMPGGASVFKTIVDALTAIKILERVGTNYRRYWKILHRVNGATQMARKMRDDALELTKTI